MRCDRDRDPSCNKGRQRIRPLSGHACVRDATVATAPLPPRIDSDLPERPDVEVIFLARRKARHCGSRRQGEFSRHNGRIVDAKRPGCVDELGSSGLLCGRQCRLGSSHADGVAVGTLVRLYWCEPRGEVPRRRESDRRASMASPNDSMALAGASAVTGASISHSVRGSSGIASQRQTRANPVMVDLLGRRAVRPEAAVTDEVLLHLRSGRT
jgi:hypothetical protein